jgi:hypothetical protein
MKKTKIFYKQIENYVEIIDIENALTRTELKSNFMNLVYQEYTKDYPNYFQDNQNSRCIDINLSNGKFYQVCIGEVMTSQDLDSVVVDMEAAAKRLRDIKTSVSEVKIIEII